jgi:hypothetical protein
VVVLAASLSGPKLGEAQTLSLRSFGCDWSASSFFSGSTIRSYTAADFTCVEDTGVWMQYELGGNWHSLNWSFNSPYYYYTEQQSPSGATDNWSTHQMCVSQCSQTEHTWVP